MSDVELERLAAEVRATSDPSARLRYAAALERLGRRDEALLALVPALHESADVRRALGKFPAWSRANANAGWTSWIDAPPLRTKPRVAWKQDRICSRVVAGPLGVVVLDESRATVLELDTGAERFSFPANERCGVQLVGDVVLTEQPPNLEARDLGTGDLLWKLDTKRPEVPGYGGLDFEYAWMQAGDRLVWVDESSVEAYAFPDPRKPPAKKRAWSVPCTRFYRDQGRETFPHVRATDDLVLVFEAFPNGASTRAVDRSGRVTWVHEGYPAPMTMDDRGAASGATYPDHLHLWDATGHVRMHDVTLEGWPEVAVLALDRVVLRGREGTQIIDRTTGALRNELPALHTCAASREVFYGASAGGAIVAWSLADGSHLWNVDSPLGEAPGLVPVANGLIGCTRNGIFLFAGEA